MTEKKSTVKVVVDRIEEELAIIVLHEDDSVKFNLPVKYLPGGAEEGDHLQVSFTMDAESRESEKKRVADLLKELTDKKN